MIKYHSCRICGQRVYKNKFKTHLEKVHNLSLQDYYHTFIAPGTNPPSCPICGKELPFYKLSDPYGTSCSSKCGNILRGMNMTRLNSDPKFQELASNGLRKSLRENEDLRISVVDRAIKNLDKINSSLTYSDRLIMVRKAMVTKSLKVDSKNGVTIRYFYILNYGNNIKVGVYGVPSSYDLSSNHYMKRLRDYRDEDDKVYDLILFKGPNDQILNLEMKVVIKFNDFSIREKYIRTEVFDASVRQDLLNYVNDLISSTTIEKVLEASELIV